jgi:hypothetical protein
MPPSSRTGSCQSATGDRTRPELIFTSVFCSRSLQQIMARSVVAICKSWSATKLRPVSGVNALLKLVFARSKAVEEGFRPYTQPMLRSSLGRGRGGPDVPAGTARAEAKKAYVAIGLSFLMRGHHPFGEFGNWQATPYTSHIHRWYTTASWRRRRAQQLRIEPLCRTCLERPRHASERCRSCRATSRRLHFVPARPTAQRVQAMSRRSRG